MSCGCGTCDECNNVRALKGEKGNAGNRGDYMVQTVEPAGVNCVNGGFKVETFDGVTNLVITTGYVCNAIDGNYTVCTDEAAGANCTYGGVKIEVFDGNTDVLLTTNYACNGAPGTNGQDGTATTAGDITNIYNSNPNLFGDTNVSNIDTSGFPAVPGGNSLRNILNYLFSLFQAGAWQTPTLSPGWSVYAVAAQYRLSSTGHVEMRGIIQNPEPGPQVNFLIFNLPVGYRPQTTVIFPVYWVRIGLGQITGFNGNDFSTVQVQPTGEVWLKQITASSTNTIIDLAAVRFYIL